MPDEHIGLRFRFGDLFPADDPVSRWLTVCSMALNDLLRVHNQLLPGLKGDAEPATNAYFARLNAAHIYEAGKFLERSERAPEIKAFVSSLDEEPRRHYERVKACAGDASGSFGEQLKHTRNHFFHYAELVPQAPEHEQLRQALEGNADAFGEIRDPGQFRDFHASFADAISVAIGVPDKAEMISFVTELRDVAIALMRFVPAAIVEYVVSKPRDSWDYI